MVWKISGFTLLLLICTLAFTDTVFADQISDVLATPLKASEGILVISVDSEVPFKSIRLKRTSEIFGELEAQDSPAGKSIYLVAMPAGHYQWIEVLLGTTNFQRGEVGLAGNDKKRYEFDVKAGKVNYPGDFVIKSQYGERLTNAMKSLNLNISSFLFNITYYIDIRDRMAMLLGRLTPEQRKAFSKIGFEYVGPGQDAFPAYYGKFIDASQVSK